MIVQRQRQHRFRQGDSQRPELAPLPSAEQQQEKYPGQGQEDQDAEKRPVVGMVKISMGYLAKVFATNISRSNKTTTTATASNDIDCT